MRQDDQPTQQKIIPAFAASIERKDRKDGLCVQDTRSTTLNSAPPLATLLTSAIGPGASIAVRARRSDAVAGSGLVRPAIGGTRPARPQSSAATHDAAPAVPDSPTAPFSDVITVLVPPKSVVSASASTASSCRVAFADA